MMKRRTLSLLLCLGLLFTAIPATADSTVAADLTQKLTSLAFDTSNVSASVHAEFFCDGELFKTLNLTQQQDGRDALDIHRMALW